MRTKDLVKRIENLKTERERTDECLAKLEAELEKRKNKTPLGVPSSNRVKTYYYVTEYGQINVFYDNDDALDKCFFDIMNYFSSKESAKKHSEMLLDWRKALVANASGQPIDIKVLLPLFKKGWVAMDESGDWFWFRNKPTKKEGFWDTENIILKDLFCFDIEPAENWETSLMDCGL